MLTESKIQYRKSAISDSISESLPAYVNWYICPYVSAFVIHCSLCSVSNRPINNSEYRVFSFLEYTYCH